MVSIGIQTIPIVIKKRTVGIQSAIHKNQTVLTQTRKPKVSSYGTQTMEQKHQYSDTTSLNQSHVYKEHVYAQENISDEYFSTSTINGENICNDSYNSTYSSVQTDNNIEENNFDEENLVNRPESAAQSSLEYSPSMIERVLNIIHGR